MEITHVHMTNITALLRRTYNDRVLVIMVTTGELDPEAVIRTIKTSDLNLATRYSANYPVVFNLVLWLSVVLAVCVLVVIVAIGTMSTNHSPVIRHNSYFRNKSFYHKRND